MLEMFCAPNTVFASWGAFITFSVFLARESHSPGKAQSRQLRERLGKVHLTEMDGS